MKIRTSLAMTAMALAMPAVSQTPKYVDPGAINPYGVLVQHAYDHLLTSTLVTPDPLGQPVEAAQVHASWLRATVSVFRWNSPYTSPQYIQTNDLLDAVYTANAVPGARKQTVVWSISNGVFPTTTWDGLDYLDGDGNDTGIHHLTMAQYEANLDDMLNHYAPEIVMIENEELANNFYTDSPEDYLIQLSHAIAKVHAHNGVDGKRIKVTDGAFNYMPLCLLTYSSKVSGSNYTAADGFADKVFNSAKVEGESINGVRVIHNIYKDGLLANGSGYPNEPADLVNGVIPGKGTYETDVDYIRDGKILIDGVSADGVLGYKDLDLDYVNFHWYNHNPNATAAEDATALGAAIQYLQNATIPTGQTSGHKVISTEMGNYVQDTVENGGDVQSLMNKISTINGLNTASADLWRQVRLIIWYDADGDPGNAVSLHWGDKNGKGGSDGGIYLGGLHVGGTAFLDTADGCASKTHPTFCY